MRCGPCARIGDARSRSRCPRLAGAACSGRCRHCRVPRRADLRTRRRRAPAAISRATSAATRQFRTEWWYVTGWLDTAHGESLGFQITFFRTKPDIDDGNPSAFAPHQMLIAHCAISDPKRGRLWQDQRIRRAGIGPGGGGRRRHRCVDRSLVAEARMRGSRTPRTSMRRTSRFDLILRETQAVLLNGDARRQPQGPAAAGRQLLLQPAAPARRRAPSRARARRRRVTAKPGSTTNGRANTSTARRRAGTGSASISTTAAR